MITISFIYSQTLPFNFWWLHLARASKNLWRGVYLLSSSRSTQRVRIINSCLSIFCNNPKSYWPNANLWVSLKKNALPLQHSTPKKDNDCIVSCSPTVNEPFYMTSSSTRCVYHELWAHYFVEENYIHNQSSLCFRVCAVFLYSVSGCAAPDVSSCSVSALRHLIRKVIQVCDRHWLHASRRLVVSCECFSLLKFEVSVNVSVDSRKSSVCSDGFHQNNLQKLNFKSWKRRQKSTAVRCFECEVSRNWVYVCFYVFISSTL